MMRIGVGDTPLAGLRVLTRSRLGDDRGHFSRLFCADELAGYGWTVPVAQINETHTKLAGTVRGMHFQQPPHLERKIVMCLRGEVFDVAVDLRGDSPTFLKWHAQILSADNGKAMLVPEGFAHGFQTLTPDVTMLYCHSTPYVASAEGGLNPKDPLLGIAWPLAVVLMSERDRGFPRLGPGFRGL